jgi:tetratricopeptide (TPR) repeat protein
MRTGLFRAAKITAGKLSRAENSSCSRASRAEIARNLTTFSQKLAYNFAHRARFATGPGGSMFRLTSVRLAQLLMLFAPTLCMAQGTAPAHVTSAEILVRVTIENDRAAGNQIRVELRNDSDVPVGETFTDSEGRASFHVAIAGQYRVLVSGTPIEGTTSEIVRVEDMDKSRTVFLRVKPKSDVAAGTVKSNAPAVTSAAELRVPSEAKKAFHKGMEAWEHNDFPKAAQQFEKAVSIYPQYDTAFNNLGVMYYQMNQTEKARKAFEQSVSLNDRNPDADRNLARILVQDGDFARAEDLLRKSLSVEPLNPISLTLMCVAEVQTGDDDGALTTARKVHQLPHEGYSVVHFVAGQALERKGQPQKASAEYETYLRESPNGAEASQVRNALTRLTASSRPNAQ